MHGEPGSGKSTVACELGRRLGAVVLDKDVIKSALLSAGIEGAAASRGAYEVYFELARSLVAQGHAVVLDNPVFWPRVEERWLATAALAGSPAILIECVCADRDELRRRLASRTVMASQPREPLDLTRHEGAAPTRFEPRLVLDTTRALEDVVEQALAYVAALTARPPLPQGERGSSARSHHGSVATRAGRGIGR
ncbi:MAG TPA: ATP-binding protein [Dehalococcoidia bacterium]|nr:ATP-binding protein [Dehalococcoidia bacterium]